MLNKFFKKFFKKNNETEYYLETVRVWEGHSYDTTINSVTYAHPVFIIKKRKLFGPDPIIKCFYYTSRIEEALDELRELNGKDFIDVDKPYNKFNVVHKWSETCNDGAYDSGSYVEN